MFKILTIRKKIILSILIGCLVPFSLGSMYIKKQTETWFYENNVENTHAILQQVANQVDQSLLNHMGSLVNAISLDERVTNVMPDINTYINYDANTFVFAETESERQISAFFKNIKESYDLITMVSMGTELGGYIEYPVFSPSSPYDPRIRSWYIEAIDSTDAIISEPYETKMTKQLVVSIDKVIMRDKVKIGVINLTIALEDIMREISSIPYGESGYINILSPNNVYINSPQNPDWLLQSADDINLEIFNSIDSNDGKYFEGTLDGVDKIFNVLISPISGWKYVSIIDKEEVLEKSKSISSLLIAIFILATFIMVILVLLSITYVTKPLLIITQIIKKMTTYDFDIHEFKEFDEYTKQQDEIGDISRAMNGMQNSFIELKNKVGIMDSEIQTIEIEDTSIFQLSLSSDNPFSAITESINDLLKKVYRYIGEIREQKDRIHFLADHDPLTNLPNRRSFNERLNRSLSMGKRGAVLMLDMDNFKIINDTLGHIFGDKVLELSASKLLELGGSSIFVSRFGGDEFLILYEFSEENNDLEGYVQQLYSTFNKYFIIDDNDINISFSMGISIFPDDSNQIDQIIMNSDLALYDVKNNEKNGFAFFTDTMASHLKYRLEIKNILLIALENQGFKMVYQPQINLKTNEIIGFEALVRLKNHNIPPSEFITVAEENGLIIPIGRLITKLVIEQIHIWIQNGLNPQPVSINFSAVQINDTKYSSYLFDLLEEYNIDPKLIVIEITEHIFLENNEVTILFMNALKAKGIGIALDDFGTEYSSLSYLSTLPIDVLKFDRDLNMRFLNSDNSSVMTHLIAFVHSLNLKIIAEGIEEHSHIEKLIAANCDYVQGYYFSKPLEVDKIIFSIPKFHDSNEPI